jgi:diketogulonate reductase-like aldo/keto reductase
LVFGVCGELYGNEQEVLGKEAIAKSGIDRKDLLMCSKVRTNAIQQGTQAIAKQLEKTLQDLGTDYVLDLYLIHWPVPRKHVVDAHKALEHLQAQARIRGNSASNYAW